MSEPVRYRFSAQTPSGSSAEGVVTAADPQAAQKDLEGIGLQPLELAPEPSTPRAPSALDAVSFNRQLAQLCAAGVPLPEGLELIAEEAGRGRLAAAARTVAAEVRSGASLEAAVAVHASAFPPGYAELVSAGVRCGRLPQVLLALAKHLEFDREVRRMIWKAVAYPLVVLLGIGGLGFWVQWGTVPAMREILREFGGRTPWVMGFLLSSAGWVPVGIMTVVLILSGLGAWLQMSGRYPLVDALLRVPWLGRAVKRALAARFCDATAVGLRAGLDLPAALAMGGAATGSRHAREDAILLQQRVAAGLDIGRRDGLRVIPPVVVLVLSMAVRGQGDASSSLERMAQGFSADAERRVAAFIAWTTPILLVILAITLGLLMFGLFSTIGSILKAMMGGGY